MSVCKTPSQGRREKFRAPGQKFRLGPLVSVAPKSRDEQKRVIESADVRISVQHLVMSKIRSQMFEFRPEIKKKISSRPQAVV